MNVTNFSVAGNIGKVLNFLNKCLLCRHSINTSLSSFISSNIFSFFNLGNLFNLQKIWPHYSSIICKIQTLQHFHAHNAHYKALPLFTFSSIPFRLSQPWSISTNPSSSHFFASFSSCFLPWYEETAHVNPRMKIRTSH